MNTAIDLFSGCGGLTLGLKGAGFDVLAAVEVNSKAVETYRANHPDVLLYSEDVRKLDPADIMRELGICPGDLSLLAGCPPCQGFSRLRTKNKDKFPCDDRNDLIYDFLRFVEILRPKLLMLENVPALALDRRFSEFVDRISFLGYKFSFKIVNAADYGVPQRRRRLIFMGSMTSTPSFPEPVERRTVRMAIGDLDCSALDSGDIHFIPERRSESVRRLIALIPKDGGSRDFLPDDMVLKCHKKFDGFRDVYGRMSWDDVSPTITSGCSNPSKGRFLHPEEDRTITLREAAILQGFPIDYKFLSHHGKESVALMIGNALPPPLIEIHARGLFIAG